jgi:diamine N-acetyltransferase
MDFRRATTADASAYADFLRMIFSETFGARYPSADLAAFLDDNYTQTRQVVELEDPNCSVYFAISHTTIIGAAHIGPLKLPVATPTETSLELYRLYIAKQHQGTGVASPLMAWAMNEMRSRGAQLAWLGVLAENLRAQRFYAKHGFRKVGAHRFQVGQHFDDDDILRARL